MNHPIFDITKPSHLTSKIVIGLERLAEAFKSMLWEQAKIHGLSPIQIRILIFVAYHPPELNNVSYLAKEFNVTKPTVSDAVRVLFNKRLIEKEIDPTDTRSYRIILTSAGLKIVDTTQHFTQPLASEIHKISPSELSSTYHLLVHLIHKLHQNGILTVQRTCFHCKFYETRNKRHFCHFLKQKMQPDELRLDCPEFKDESTPVAP
ncbi:MarR family transcriptional regulator [Flavobacteriaceae bacterium F08102]|nr:MarR family transcriptional regulator [Flavobacteriaceae bacterium F08102]